MRFYKTRAVDRLFERNKRRLEENVRKLIHTTGYFISDPDEMLQEMCILFYKNFEEFYEEDRQYLSFLFVCMKNKIRNHQRKEYTNINRFTTDLNSLRSQTGASTEQDSAQAVSYSSVWGQVKDPHCEWTKRQMVEIVEHAKSKLVGQELEVFNWVVDGEMFSEIVEINKLRDLYRLTPSQKSRLTALERKLGPTGLCLKETVDMIQYSIRPTLLSCMVQEGLPRKLQQATV